ncbi:MAG: hypothetical protein Q8Q31_00320 [Nanoarchaeota archaeon]|nr:hypothetical protein [Nanoarchaeota archaeon]
MEHVKIHLPGSHTSGSIFTHPKFRTARNVADYAYDQISGIYKGQRLVLTVDFGEMVGLEGVIAIKEIPKHIPVKRVGRERKSYGKRPHSYTVPVAYGIKRTPTNKITIIAEPVVDNGNLHAFSSIFPGNYAPDFSDVKFWNQHALISERRS